MYFLTGADLHLRMWPKNPEYHSLALAQNISLAQWFAPYRRACSIQIILMVTHRIVELDYEGANLALWQVPELSH